MRRSHIAIGYKLSDMRHGACSTNSIVVNPNKDAEITLFEGDCIIVVAEG